MNRFIYYLLLFLSFSSWSFASSTQQLSVTLNWKGLEQNVSDASLVFDNSTCLDNSRLPYYTLTIPLENNQTVDSLKLKDIQTNNLTLKESNLIKNSPSPDSDYATLKVTYLFDRKQKKALLYFLPILDQNGTFEKITSCTLEYSINTENGTNLRSASSAGLHSFVSNSVLKTGAWIKIAVSQTGIHKISYSDLVAWGVADPSNARVFGYGGAKLHEDFNKSKIDDLPQVAVWKETGVDGIFNEGDYLLFYAQGPISWEYNTSESKFNRTINPYSFKGYYFISSDAGVEKTISTKAALTGTPTVAVTNFLDYQLHELEMRNFLSSGQEWYGEEFSSTATQTFSFIFPNVAISKKAKITVAACANPTTDAGSTMSVSLNSNSFDLKFNKISTYVFAERNLFNTDSILPSSSKLDINLKYNDSASKAWLNYISVNAFRHLIMDGSSMAFRQPEIIASSQLAEYSLTADAGLVIWDITDPANAKHMSVSYTDGKYVFLDSAVVLKEYVALDPSAEHVTPEFAGQVVNQDLHGLAQKDMVIVTHSDYYKQAEVLAEKHRVHDGISVITVFLEQVYNEFSSGVPDATAIRWFMKMFFDRASTSEEAPKYLLLFGDGTYDNRLIESKNQDTHKLPCYEAKESLHEINSYVTDDYFGLLDDSEGSYIPSGNLEVGIGRFPVSTESQASDLVAKICAYMDNNEKGYWKNRLIYIADDDDDTRHTFDSDRLVKYMETTYPYFQPKRLFLDSYLQETSASGESYPLAKEYYLNLIDQGIFLLNYTGHGSIEGLSNEKIISRNDIANMYNKKLPLFVTASCSFSHFDNSKSSAGEDMFLNNHGGAIGLFSTSRTVYSNNNYALNSAFNKYIFKIENGKPLALGEIMRRSKNDLSDLNRLSFTLLADPALVMHVPLNKVIITEVSSNSNVVGDTIKALSTVSVKGEIQSSDSMLLNNFNGIVTAVVYDKKMSVSTMANDDPTIYTYLDRTNMLFNGKTTVVDGKFTITFMVPKDIAYNYDFGRINLYAADETNDLEAQGYYEDFYVGGSKSDFVFENEGPIIDMYLNTSNFINGESVDSTPVFEANISDENGINAVGGGIGHDLYLSLNDNPNLSYVLNNYYESSFGDYRSGKLVYEIPKLEDGSYTLTFRAWDLLNNSSTETLTFNVENGIKPHLYTFYAAPNPAESYVNFIFKHDQPQSEMNIELYVYNLTGELLWQTEKTVYSDENIAEISWDLTTSSGRKLLRGIYLYTVYVESEEKSDFSRKSNKLLVR